MAATVPTIYYANLVMAQRFAKQYTLLPNSTLNQKFSIEADSVPPSNRYPTSRFLAIGNGRHSGNTTSPTFYHHRARDSSLYNQLPFVLRTPDNDIGSTLRAKYALRTNFVKDGVTYIAYWLKRVDTDALNLSNEIRTIDLATGQITQSSAFTPAASDLNPTPNTTIGSNSTTRDYIGCYMSMDADLISDTEMDEFMNVCNIIYGTNETAFISEIAMCCGYDKSITITLDNGDTTSFLEAICVSVMEFFDTYQNLASPTARVSTDSEYAVTTPLLASE